MAGRRRKTPHDDNMVHRHGRAACIRRFPRCRGAARGPIDGRTFVAQKMTTRGANESSAGEQAGTRVTLLPGPRTGSSCADQRAAELERRIIDMLRDRALTATIRGSSLSLVRDDSVGVVFMERGSE